jgi:hypothetical protein
MPSEYKVFAENPLQHVQLMGFLTPTLTLNWPTLRIFRRTCPTDIIALPEYITLTYLQSFRIRRMLRNKYSATIIFQYSGRIHDVAILHPATETPNSPSALSPNSEVT